MSTQSLRSLNIYTVHGVPSTESIGSSTFEEPTSQFEALLAPLSPYVPNREDYRWAEERLDRTVLLATRLYRSGNFCNNYRKRFGEWLESKLYATGTGDCTICVGYSSGALLLYDWLSRSEDRYVSKIDMCFCLAGPFRFTPGGQTMFFEGLPDHPITVIEPSLDPEKIARLQRWRLVAIQGEKDGTVIPFNTSFPDQLSYSMIDQHTILGASHRDLCRHPATIDYVVSRIIGAILK